jgi:hypothetical protein
MFSKNLEDYGPNDVIPTTPAELPSPCARLISHYSARVSQCGEAPVEVSCRFSSALPEESAAYYRKITLPGYASATPLDYGWAGPWPSWVVIVNRTGLTQPAASTAPTKPGSASLTVETPDGQAVAFIPAGKMLAFQPGGPLSLRTAGGGVVQLWAFAAEQTLSEEAVANG